MFDYLTFYLRCIGSIVNAEDLSTCYNNFSIEFSFLMAQVKRLFIELIWKQINPLSLYNAQCKHEVCSSTTYL